MTNLPSANIRPSTILLALACLCSCQSTTTATDGPGSTQPAKAASSGHAGIDRAYLLTVHKLDEEKQQALQDARQKELSPAQMRALEDSFESRRQRIRGAWLEARARHTRK